MDKFTCVEDIGDLRQAVAEALRSSDRFQFTGLGRNKTLLMLFFNSSLRTAFNPEGRHEPRHERHGPRRQPGGVETLETQRVWLDGRRQGRTPARSHSGHGIVLRRDRRKIVRTVSGQSRGLHEERVLGAVHPPLGPSGLLDGGRDAPPVAEFRRPDHHRGAQGAVERPEGDDLGAANASCRRPCPTRSPSG